MRLLNILTAFAVIVISAAVNAEDIRDFYAEPGLHPFKDPIQSQSESIDPFAGMLRIQATDLMIPGNGGLDIKVTRSYLNPQNEVGWYDGITGIGWTMHFGRITVPASAADKACNQLMYSVHTGDNPSIEHQDGSRELLVLAADGSGDLVTKSNWKARCLPGDNGFQVFSPGGTEFIMDAVSYTTPEKSWFVSGITDVHGNRIAFDYAEKNGLLYISKVRGLNADGVSDGRIVDFHYADELSCKRLTSISANGTTIAYTLTPAPGYMANSCKYQLTDVSLPEQMSWHYDYLGILPDGTAGTNSMSAFINPYGGRMDFTYQYVYFNPSSTYKTTSIRTKTTSGQGVVSGIWTYSFLPNSYWLSDPASGLSGYADRTVVDEPYGKTEYIHQGYSTSGMQSYWAVGLLLGKHVYDGGNNLLEWNAYYYGKRLISYENYYHGRADLTGEPELDSETHSILLMRHAVWRKNGTHETIYSGHDAYGNPATKEETTIISGQPNRITQFTYLNNPTKWIIGKVQNETIVGIGTISRNLDNNTGDLISENRYGVTTTYTYLPTGNVETVTNASGYITTYRDYYRGIPRLEEHPEGKVIVRTVNATGTVQTYVNGRGYTTQYNYDQLNRLTGIATQIHNPVSVAWTPASMAPSARRQVTRGALIQTINYDGFGRPLEQRYTDAVTGTVITKTYGYDALGRVVFESHPNSTAGESYEYDNLGRRTKITHADGAVRRTEYGTGGVLITETDERGKQSTYIYKAYGSPDNSPALINAHTPGKLGTICTYHEYNLIGQTTLTHQGSLDTNGVCIGVSRHYTYNARYQLDTETNPELETIQYGRDMLGNMTSKQVGTSGVTTYHYDGLQRLRHTYYSDSTPDASFDYDLENNLVGVNNGISSVTYGYDANNNLESKTLAIDGKVYSLGYAYDGNDSQTAMTYPSGRTVNYYPDAFGRPTRVAPYITNLTYHPSGQIDTMTYANGITTKMDIQARLWLGRIHTYGGAGNLVDLNYAYDPAGNAEFITDGVDPGNNRSMIYDDANRLESALGPWGSMSYSYDANGNITSHVINGQEKSYGYFNQRLVSYGAVGDVKQVAHDIYGNVEYISKQVGSSIEERHFMYDAAGTMGTVNKRVVVNGETTITTETYSYDGSGDRIKKVNVSGTTYYLHKSTGFLVAENKDDPVYGKEYIYLGNQLIANVQTNRPPLANAGSDLTVFISQSVTLDGGSSSDQDGTLQSYAWTQTSGTPVTLTGHTTATPGFTAPAVTTAQTLTFLLTVTDNEGDSSSDSVTVTVQPNSLPIANAGPDQGVLGSQTVSLDGTASHDPDGSITSYAWQQTQGTLVALNGATTATPGFTAPYVTATTALTFRLTVTDNSGGTASDTVVITVNPGDITPPVLTGSYVMRKSKGATYYDVTLAANEPATFSYGVRGADGRPTGVISNPSSTAQTAAFTVQRTEAGDLTVFYSALDTAGNSASSTLLLK